MTCRSASPGSRAADSDLDVTHANKSQGRDFIVADRLSDQPTDRPTGGRGFQLRSGVACARRPATANVAVRCPAHCGPATEQRSAFQRGSRSQQLTAGRNKASGKCVWKAAVCAPLGSGPASCTCPDVQVIRHPRPTPSRLHQRSLVVMTTVANDVTRAAAAAATVLSERRTSIQPTRGSGASSPVGRSDRLGSTSADDDRRTSTHSM